MRQLPSFDVYISFYFLYFKYLLQKIQISNVLPAQQGLLQIVLVKSSVVCTFSSTLCHNYHIPEKFSVSYVRYRTSTFYGISPYKSSSIVAKTIRQRIIRFSTWRSRGGREYFLKCPLWILLAGYTAVFYVVI